jgi:hypothetical protein
MGINASLVYLDDPKKFKNADNSRTWQVPGGAVLEKARNFLSLFEYCAAQGRESAVCAAFWRDSPPILFGLFAVIGVVCIAVAGYFIHRKLRVNRQKLARRLAEQRANEIAPELRMQHSTWKGDGLHLEADEAALAAKIRQGLNERKLNQP